VKVILREGCPSSGQISEYLQASGIQSLFIEGGAEVLNHFISTGFWMKQEFLAGMIF